MDQEPQNRPASYLLPLWSQIFSSPVEFNSISKMKMDAGIYVHPTGLWTFEKASWIVD